MMNKNFQRVFTTQSTFEQPQGEVSGMGMQGIQVNRKEIQETIKELKER